MLQSKSHSADQQKVVERSCDPRTCKNCPLNNHLMDGMRKSMADEMEQRRLAWEKDVIRLQEDFFRVKLDHLRSDDQHLAIEGPGGDAGSTHRENESDSMFILRFNVKNCKPEDISVKAEGDKLIVSAKSTQEDGTSKKVIKQFNKQVDIPSNVEIEKMISYLTPDGILTVEAPKMSSHLSNQHPHDQRSTPALMSTAHDSQVLSSVTSSGQQIVPFSGATRGDEKSLTFPMPISGLTDIHETEYGLMLALNVDLGSSCYLPSEVKVRVYRNKIGVSASHEEVSEGRSSKKEFQREFDISEPIEMPTLQAVLDTRSGIVFLGASFVSNTKHNMVACLISKRMPMIGKQCNVEQCC